MNRTNITITNMEIQEQKTTQNKTQGQNVSTGALVLCYFEFDTKRSKN